MSDATIKITSRKSECLSEFEASKDKALEMIGLIAERYAKDGARVDTGRLRNSITHATAKNEGVGVYHDNNGKSYSDAKAVSTPEDDAVYIGTNVEYAQYIELGTSRNHGSYPFLRPAAQNHADEYKKIICCVDSTFPNDVLYNN